MTIYILTFRAIYNIINIVFLMMSSRVDFHFYLYRHFFFKSNRKSDHSLLLKITFKISFYYIAFSNFKIVEENSFFSIHYTVQKPPKSLLQLLKEKYSKVTRSSILITILQEFDMILRVSQHFNCC